MKKIIIAVMFVCGFSAAYSQTTITIDQNDYNKMLLDNDSLHKALNIERDRLTGSTKLHQDSISRLIATHKAEVAELNKKLSKAEKDLVNANKKVAALDKNAVKTERDNLQKQVDILKSDTATLQKQLSEKDGQLANAQIEHEAKILEAKEHGRAEALSNLIDAYTKPFDDLIKSSTKQSVERDLLLVDNDNDEATRKKLQDLQKYFDAKQILSEPYSEQKVDTAQTQISTLEQTEFVKELAVQLKKYKSCNEGLKSAVNELLEIDRKFAANNDNTQKTKMQDIAYAISRYFYDYPSFSFSNYPYLTNVIWEIWTKKQKDANADISDLLEKL
jgi:hypothetical protein